MAERFIEGDSKGFPGADSGVLNALFDPLDPCGWINPSLEYERRG